MEKDFSSLLTNILRSSLDEIDPTLSVKTLFITLARAYDKGFYLSANYPKRFGELFIKLMMDKHPGNVPYHVEQVRGSRQDMILEALIAIYIERLTLKSWMSPFKCYTTLFRSIASCASGLRQHNLRIDRKSVV